jgi:hypothetical protein
MRPTDADRGTALAFTIARSAQRRASVWRAVALLALAVAALVSMVGCELQPVAIHVVDERAVPEPIDFEGAPMGGAELPAIVVEACEQLALECYALPDGGRGIVELRLVDDAGKGIRGKTEGRGLCRKGLRAEPHAETIAHELAHVFLLEHVDDPSNLMHEHERERDDDASLDADQFDDMHASAARFVGGC